MSLSATLTSIVGEAGIGTLDALDGIPLARPENVEQAAELLRLVSRERLPAVFIGRGSKLGWSLLNQTPKLAVSTERLRGVLEFEPGDGVITALAGTPMDELEHATGAA
ncbi:MAG: glycolate oxidase FAD binding subunit, partial [Candidatus Paceibacteria bacterium]